MIASPSSTRGSSWPTSSRGPCVRAFASQDTGQPFGFEYVPDATFREMNFGRMDEQESPTAFAGEVMPRKGFSVCRRCGGVQGADGEVLHTFTCGASGDQSIVDCLYLYREFNSEAVRILIPHIGSPDAEQRNSSFIAALELGLRRRFAGAVDHLRVATCKFPPAESGADLTFLMLYDRVPGGTRLPEADDETTPRTWLTSSAWPERPSCSASATRIR